MPKSTQKKKRSSKVKPIAQISESHCGPAVIQMLLDNLGVEVTQEDITKAAGAEKTIEVYGVNIEQMAKAVHTLAPGITFWYKSHSTLEDLLKVLNEYEYPAGIDWQGLFEDTLEEEDENTDYGHYSIISTIDSEKKEIIMVDPYKEFVNQNRIIPVKLFLKRWWDTNEEWDQKTGTSRTVETEQLFFILTDSSETFPLKLGMKKFRFPIA